MSKQSLSHRIIASAAIIMLCLSPAAIADDGLSPFSFFDSVKAYFLDLGDWIGELLDGSQNENGEGDDGDDGGVPDLHPEIQPIG